MSKLTDALPGWCNVDNIAGLSQSELNAAMRQYAQQCIEARNQQGDAVDAARYRFLREFGYGLPKLGAELDSSIDTAIEQRKADKKGGA